MSLLGRMALVNHSHNHISRPPKVYRTSIYLQAVLGGKITHATALYTCGAYSTNSEKQEAANNMFFCSLCQIIVSILHRLIQRNVSPE